MLADAIARTSPEMAISKAPARAIVDLKPGFNRESGSSVTFRPSFGSGYCSSSAAPMACMWDSACSWVTPGLSLPTTLKTIARRSPQTRSGVGWTCRYIIDGTQNFLADSESQPFETLFRDPDDRERGSVDHELRADDSRVGSEPILPGLVSQDDDGARARSLIVFGLNQSS